MKNIAFLIFAIITSSISLVSAATDEEKFKSLEQCLKSARVNSNNIVYRNSTTSSSKYTELNHQWNTYKGTIYPLGYIIPKTVSDVQATVKCCQKNKIRLVSKSGGHSFEKYSFGNSHSIVLDLKELNNVQIESNGKFVNIGPGNTNGLIQYKLLTVSTKRKDNLLVPYGVCPNVGIGGLALGGGFGFFSPSYGLMSDNIVGLDMVDANGRLLKINEKLNPDLYWAHRGAGGGNFGIVTNFKIKAYPAPKSVIYGQVIFKFDQFPEFFKAWQSKIVNQNDTTLSLYPYIIGEPANIISLQVTKPVADKSGINSAMQQVKTILDTFPKPLNSTVSARTYEEFLEIVAQQFGNPIIKDISEFLNLPNYPTRYSKMKTFYMDKILNAPQIQEFYSLFRKFLNGPGTFILMQAYEGIINNVGRTDTAFVHRKAGKGIFYDIAAYVRNTNGKTIGNANSLSLADEFYNQTKLLYNHKESYQNYIDGDLETTDYLERYYAENLPRLVQIKKKIDPNNFFNFPMSIPTKLTKKC